MADARMFYPATARNREPILRVLEDCLPERGSVLEIGSGSGEHAAFFAARFPHLRWQPSDPDPRCVASIAAWREHGGQGNIDPPLEIDVTTPSWAAPDVAAVLSINMIHIAPWAACEGLMRGAGALLPEGGLLFLYGPFKIDGAHTAPSNAAFDGDLRARDPSWGVRDLDAVNGLAGEHGLRFVRRVAMPANNQSVIYRRADPDSPVDRA